jgi:hypothetical protein
MGLGLYNFAHNKDLGSTQGHETFRRAVYDQKN